jgi:hypothetical protein
LVNTLIKEKRHFFDTLKFHTINFTLPCDRIFKKALFMMSRKGRPEIELELPIESLNSWIHRLLYNICDISIT